MPGKAPLGRTPVQRGLHAAKLFDVLVHLGEGKDVDMGFAEKEALNEFDPAFVWPRRGGSGKRVPPNPCHTFRKGAHGFLIRPFRLFFVSERGVI